MMSYRAGALPGIAVSLALSFLSIALIATPAFAVYKCEQSGIITYTDVPCEGEKLPLHSTEPARGMEDKTLASEKKEVARLQALREQRERQEKQIRDLSARGASARERKCKSLALQLKWREEDLREAPLNAQPKARKLARRSAEKYRTDCQ